MGAAIDWLRALASRATPHRRVHNDAAAASVGTHVALVHKIEREDK